MIEILTPIPQLLKHQQELPEADRQSSVMLRFAAPVNITLTSDFYRIHLTREMKQEGHGEKEFYRPEVFQPSRSIERKECPTCKRWMAKITVNRWKCQNARCASSRGWIESGPVRGVVAVDVNPKDVVSSEQVNATIKRANGTSRELVGTTGLPIKVQKVLISGCILRLDRRYDQNVLAGVYRSAGMICEMYGWRLL